MRIKIDGGSFNVTGAFIIVPETAQPNLCISGVQVNAKEGIKVLKAPAHTGRQGRREGDDE